MKGTLTAEPCVRTGRSVPLEKIHLPQSISGESSTASRYKTSHGDVKCSIENIVNRTVITVGRQMAVRLIAVIRW